MGRIKKPPKRATTQQSVHLDAQLTFSNDCGSIHGDSEIEEIGGLENSLHLHHEKTDHLPETSALSDTSYDDLQLSDSSDNEEHNSDFEDLVEEEISSVVSEHKSSSSRSRKIIRMLNGSRGRQQSITQLTENVEISKENKLKNGRYNHRRYGGPIGILLIRWKNVWITKNDDTWDETLMSKGQILTITSFQQLNCETKKSSEKAVQCEVLSENDKPSNLMNLKFVPCRLKPSTSSEFLTKIIDTLLAVGIFSASLQVTSNTNSAFSKRASQKKSDNEENQDIITSHCCRVKCEIRIGFSQEAVTTMNDESSIANDMMINENEEDSCSTEVQSVSNNGKFHSVLYRHRKFLKQFFDWLYPELFSIPVPKKSEASFHINAEYFFELVKLINHHILADLFNEKQINQISVLPSLNELRSLLSEKLKCQLTQYQLRAVKFALWREKGGCFPSTNEHTDLTEHFNYCNETKYYLDSAVRFSFETKIPQNSNHSDLWADDSLLQVKFKPTENEIYKIKGGLLCDEMGLGKTVEVLGLLMVRPASTEFLQYPFLDYKNEVKKERETLKTEDTTDKSSVMEESPIGCFCGILNWDIDAEWIQCDVCDEWFHTGCVGIDTSLSSLRRPLDEYKNATTNDCCKMEVKFRKMIPKTELCLNEEKQNSSINEEPYICPVCFARSFPPLPVKATLVVVPSSIMSQWKLEISKHVASGALFILEYKGIELNPPTESRRKRQRRTPDTILEPFAFVNPSTSPISHPFHFFSADIVLCSYETLRSELFVEFREPRQFRQRKAHRILPTPLLSVKWWRIILDEAQMVEGFSQAAQMAAKLHTEHRWCVTGTPVTRSLAIDLPYLLLALAPVGFTLVQQGSNEFLTFKNLARSLDAEFPQQLEIPLEVVEAHLEKREQDVRMAFSYKEETMPEFKSNGSKEFMSRRRNDFWAALHDRTMTSLSVTPQDNILTVLYQIYKCWGRAGDSLIRNARLLAPLMWRTHAEDVTEELGLPPITITTITLNFTSLERYFYQRQQEKVLAATRKFIQPSYHQHFPNTNCSSADGSDERNLPERTIISPDTNDNIITGKLERMVLALRQACIHPQIGSKGLGPKPGGRGDYNALFPSCRLRRRRRARYQTQIGGSFVNKKSKTSSGDEALQRLTSSSSEICSTEKTESDNGKNKRSNVEKKLTTSIVREVERKNGGKAKKNRQLGEVPRFMSTVEVLSHLLKEAQINGEEQLRIICASSNGLAGLSWIREDYENAIKEYRFVLQQASSIRAIQLRQGNDKNKLKDVIRVDDLQILHAMSNLQLLFETIDSSKIGSVGKTLLESNLSSEIELLTKKYLLRSEARLNRHRSAFAKNYSLVNELYKSLSYASLEGHRWWALAVEAPSQSELIRRVKDSLANHQNSRLAKTSTRTRNKTSHREASEKRDTYFQELLRKETSSKNLNSLSSSSNRLLKGQNGALPVSFRDSVGLVFVLTEKAEALELLRERLIKGVGLLERASKCLVSQMNKNNENNEGQALWNSFQNCRRCRSHQGAGTLCWHCSLAIELDEYLQFFKALRPGEGTNEAGRMLFGEGSNVGGDSDFVFVLNILSTELKKVVANGSIELPPNEKRSKKHHNKLVSTISENDGVEDSSIQRFNRTIMYFNKYMDALQKEFYRLSTLFGTTYDTILAIDELRMSQERFRVKTPEEIIADKSSTSKTEVFLNVLHPSQVPYVQHQLESERVEAERHLTRIKGHLRFLGNLSRSHNSLDESNSTHTSTTATTVDVKRCEGPITAGSGNIEDEADRCPICYNVFGHESQSMGLALLPCAHSLCIDCYREDVGLHTVSYPCPICRATSPICEVLFVCNDADSTESLNLGAQPGLERISVNGSWSAKIEAVVRRIRWILMQNSRMEEELSAESIDRSYNSIHSINNNSQKVNDKVIIFTEWNEAMTIVLSSLLENGIDAVVFKGGQADRPNLTKFLTVPECSVLICNLKRAGQGLTLTTANHVVFLEPCLSPADELQAIGRIRRIGQKKPQYVWRFVLKESVEEKIIERTRTLTFESKHHHRHHGQKRKLKKQVLTLADIRFLFGQSHTPE